MKFSRRMRWAARMLAGKYQLAYEPGHFYSVIPPVDEVAALMAADEPAAPENLPGIDINRAGQLALLAELSAFGGDLAFTDTPGEGRRYGWANDNFAFADGTLLAAMLRHFRPKRMIEVGSGWSSAMTLDVNELYLDRALDLTFIEPFPELLKSLLKPEDRINLIEKKLQDVPAEIFAALQAGDVLFIDSTHVARVGSDVNCLFFDIMPGLAPGVMVHIHDIFWPFEYPRQWIADNRAWNELYLLRAFLMDNSQWEIIAFGDYLKRTAPEAVAQHLPLMLKQPRSGSVWLRKTG